MEQILIVREVVIKFFKKYEAFILPICKFLLALFVFNAIQSIGQVHASIAPLTEELSPMLLNVLFAVFFTIMPMNLGWLLVLLNIVAQFSAHLEIAIAVFIFLLFVFVFYARMAPKESILILFTILAFHFNVPYLVPIVAGLYFSITAIIPIALGVFINAQIPMLLGITQHTTTIGNVGDLEISELLTEIPEAFSVVHETLMHSLTVTNTWLFTAVIFVMVTLLVHFVSRLSIDFTKEIAIAFGCIMNIFGFVVAVLVTEETANIGMVIFLTIVCGLLAWLIRCLDSILDYSRAESVQFEDDNNYYHVRIVPKIILTKSKRVVKRIRPEEETRGRTAPRPQMRSETGRTRPRLENRFESSSQDRSETLVRRRENPRPPRED